MITDYTDDESLSPHEHCATTGHAFVKKTFHRPTWCHYCTELLWGLIGQGFVCEICNFVAHERCLRTLSQYCSSIKEFFLVQPQAHTFIDIGSFKKKFCCVCRRRVENSYDLKCEVCEVYCHIDCRDFAIRDCRVTALSYSAGKRPVLKHQWREGNLLGNAKCLACKKSSAQVDMFTGMRCDWCHISVHSSCIRSVDQECDLGVLRNIYLPRETLLLPITNLSMEEILNCTNRRKAPSDRLQLGDSKTDQDACLSDDGITYDSIKNTADHDQCSTSAGGPSNTTGLNSNLMDRLCNSQNAANSVQTKRKDKLRIRSKRKESREVTSHFDDDLDDSTVADVEDPYSDVRSSVVKHRFYLLDGNQSIETQTVRIVSMTMKETAIYACLKALHICDDAKKYYLLDASRMELEKGTVGDPVALEDQQVMEMIESGTRESAQPTFVIRYRISSRGEPIKIFLQSPKHAPRLKYVKINHSLAASDIIEMALQKFGMADGDLDNFVLIMSSSGLEEQMLVRDQLVWPLVENSIVRNVRNLHYIRFYLRECCLISKPVRVFVGNLPPKLPSKKYESYVTDITKINLSSRAFNPVYPQYGCVVVEFPDAQTAKEAVQNLRATSFEDGKPIVVLVLPFVDLESLGPTVSPLLVFVNAKSGGCQGVNLLTHFRRLLNPFQVFDLDNGGPIPGLVLFGTIPNYRILVCGGDGSMGWVLSCLDDVGQESKCSSPPIAILPLGTGNDLARVLQWGGGYTGTDEPLQILKAVDRADPIDLDRWTVIMQGDEREKQILTDRKSLKMEGIDVINDVESNVQIMNNYFGIGLDADISLGFHMKREENPSKFNNRLHNKAVYFRIGIKKLYKPNLFKDLQNNVKVIVDGSTIPLPPIEGIIILNIGSWSAGADLWGAEREDKFRKPSQCDGLVEVVGVSGIFHMGQILSGMRTAYRLAQGQDIQIYTQTTLPVQMDGEPWIQPPGCIMVTRSALHATLLKKRKSGLKRGSRASGSTADCMAPEPASTGSFGADDDLSDDDDSDKYVAPIHGIANAQLNLSQRY